MKITIKSGRYQRNGISGIGFYQIRFDWREGSGHGKNFIATFETDETGGEHVKVDSTRVIDPSHFSEAWRGDDFGTAIQRELSRLMEKKGVNNIYDVIGEWGRAKKKSHGRKAREEKIL